MLPFCSTLTDSIFKINFDGTISLPNGTPVSRITDEYVLYGGMRSMVTVEDLITYIETQRTGSLSLSRSSILKPEISNPIFTGGEKGESK